MTQVPADVFAQFRSAPQYAAGYGGVIQTRAPLCHHLLQIPVAQAVAQVEPPKRSSSYISSAAASGASGGVAGPAEHAFMV